MLRQTTLSSGRNPGATASGLLRRRDRESKNLKPYRNPDKPAQTALDHHGSSIAGSAPLTRKRVEHLRGGKNTRTFWSCSLQISPALAQTTAANAGANPADLAARAFCHRYHANSQHNETALDRSTDSKHKSIFAKTDMQCSRPDPPAASAGCSQLTFKSVKLQPGFFAGSGLRLSAYQVQAPISGADHSVCHRPFCKSTSWPRQRNLLRNRNIKSLRS